MADAIYVLDASAILAAFFDEPGADVIGARMESALLSAVNYHEVVATLLAADHRRTRPPTSWRISTWRSPRSIVRKPKRPDC